ncbi:glycosyltransferase family 4 protein [Desulfitobacterium chlororespirans]|uniref:Glycosyltransferase involved in cell wall bisynthesis n=1 Tax=Desulfitobacterium chlororespirans DSM 11544 TaxID=1121395 RepID=A0A1M7U9H5_9FIRM|nr:glycosyltransferase family 4 protein [Desulfitobacterium chlororespirans]SHN79575.1 Glycosyltransferase involved in cell wall bisynthesis [Desulfitobacterium chlororespirans DSM 11544]
MKILVISHMYPSTQNPTYGIFVHEQVKALVAGGCEVKVISPVPYAPWPLPVLKKKWQAYASMPAKDRVDGIEVFYPRYPEFPRSYLLEHSGALMYLGLRNLVKTIGKEFPFDLIHAHVALPDGHAAYGLKKEFPVPGVVTIHGQDFQSTLHKGPSCRKRLQEVLLGTDSVITVSTKLKNLVKDEPYYPKIQVINNGIHLAEIDRAEVSRSRARDQITILSVSNLKKTKGIDLNLRALASLVKTYPNLTYRIVGDGEERKNLEALAESLDLGNHVFFLGKLPHREALQEMAQADIFCLPSWQEGFGVVYIEAMSLGIPVIGVKGEGIEDVIDPGINGLLVRPHEVEDLAEALESLLKSPDYARRLAEAGKATVLAGFTWEHNAARTIELYRSLLGR